jgi:hypothetical protein
MGLIYLCQSLASSLGYLFTIYYNGCTIADKLDITYVGHS